MKPIKMQRIQVKDGHWIEVPTHRLLRMLAHLELALFDRPALRALRAMGSAEPHF